MASSVGMPKDVISRDSGALPWVWLSVGIFVADQLTKYLATTYLNVHQPVPVMPLFNLTLVHNTGVAFSFLSNAGNLARWLLVALALVVSTIIVWWLKRLPSGQRITAIPLSLILGGAMGNVWDRIQYGYVVDFIDLYYNDWHWPAFNIADSAITVGAVILIFGTLRPRPEQAG
jgi:signal peptidase II